ncbi:F-actin capping protein, alpha subunit [Monocercomonoides exilis]|uniref:F-actin capping protein, alpha subunit n=1 Tax=Monocercomonoides exilis TaxID=2049356 RepID=UPI003559E9BF|nr:F-actin capping protein, alpha subunit [Monocercomonoides exilis]|eukprot:MONOS_10647.1-p1 / transcript=MONOS_10647.1 / gene=MONOS_10647 / organism=Monocercomonoides_exilis_PA203 / gene_product=F-actin capping protein, alpha subunit / transcript_product=F-actin capping protein, alpha subunit / location=Mono_scaffold00492:20365-21642(+) / protein_length=291 / sequence_SO=supercontig / SO=protein_coding / is_pseudo=false
MTEEEQPIDEETDFQETIGRFILSSPPQEENDVYQALETIVGDSKDLSPLKEQYFHQRHIEQYQVVTIPETKEKMLICQFGELDDTHYLDPRGKRIITYDHSTKTVTDVQPLEEESTAEHEPLRKAIDDAITKYVSDHFPDGVCSVFASDSDDGGKAIIICINSTKVNPKSMWGGQWKSTWILELSEDKHQLSGEMSVAAHFFEAGNVHLNTEDRAERKINASENLAQIAKDVKNAIISEEQKFQQSIDESFIRLAESSFRALRMKLPRSKTKINWDVFALQGNMSNIMPK